jgi:hypothetical protein
MIRKSITCHWDTYPHNPANLTFTAARRQREKKSLPGEEWMDDVSRRLKNTQKYSQNDMGMTLIYIYIYICVCVCVFYWNILPRAGPCNLSPYGTPYFYHRGEKLFIRCPVLIDNFRKNVRNTACNYMDRTKKIQTVPWLWRSLAGLSTRRSALHPRPVYVACVMNKVSVSFHQGPMFIIHPLSALYKPINWLACRFSSIIGYS